MCSLCSKENVQILQLWSWGMERMSEMPSATSISQLRCAGRAEGNSRALDAGRSRQVWLCTMELSHSWLRWCAVCEPVCGETRSISCMTDTSHSGTRQCPWVLEQMLCASFWQLLSALFCFSGTSQELLEAATLEEWWVKYSLTFARVCSSWKRAQDSKPPCSEAVKGVEGGEEGQALRGKDRLP